MKVSLKKDLLNIEGVKMDDSVSTCIGALLCNAKSELSTVKAYTIGMDLYKEKSIDIEKETVLQIKNAVEKAEGYPVFIKAQCIIALDEVLDKYKTKE